MKHNLMFNSLLLLALAPAAFASTTWYVNGVSGSNTNNCTSATTACKSIGHAIALAHSGDSIMVAAATYTEHLTIALNLTILGSNAQTTIIDGGGVNRVVTISNSAARVTLSQLTIRHGSAPKGGGIYSSGNLTINHCVISGNSATAPLLQPVAGGGIYSSGNLTINHCVISGNSASEFMIIGGSGGGIEALGLTTINNSAVSGNIAGGGGGISADGLTTINNSTISGNSADISGGGIAGSSTLTINNTTITGNSAGGVMELEVAAAFLRTA